jgi:acyl-CoA thioester hydrolase
VVKKYPVLKFTDYELAVRVGETDPYGVVNNAVYYIYFEAARIDYAMKCGKPLDEMFNSKVVNMTISLECKYINACKFGDTLLIKTSMKPHAVFCTYEFKQWIYNKNTNELLAEAKIKTCEFDVVNQRVLRWI